MFRHFLITVIMLIGAVGCIFVSIASADPERQAINKEADLFLVMINSHSEADALSNLNVDAILKVNGGYLILIDDKVRDLLMTSGLEYEFIASQVSRSCLAIDKRSDSQNAEKYQLIFEYEGVKLYRVEEADLRDELKVIGLIPIRRRPVKIFYKDPIPSQRWSKTIGPDLDIDSLVDLVSQDSLESYSYALQVYKSRVVGGGSNRQCALWLKNKFAEFGYDSIVSHAFSTEDWWGDPVSGDNVLVYKIGSTYERDQIIIGAHFDGVQGSPAADDNGSGTAAVVEIARILKDVETDMTFIFALWDGEERGLCGSEEYASEASARGDRIIFNLNMDMIAFEGNDDLAYLYYGGDNVYAVLWAELADSLSAITITGQLKGSAGNSDHASFVTNGYDAMMAHEAVFSNVYHSPRDSTSYMNFEYFRQVCMGSLATAYYVDQSFIPAPALYFEFSEEMPNLIQPGESPVVVTQIDEYAGAQIFPGSVQMHYSINDEPYSIIPMTALGENFYEAQLPLLSCGDIMTYYLQATDIVSAGFYRYPDPASPAWATMITAIEVIFEDNFDSDKGWIVSGDAFTGHWERWQAGGNYADPTSDYDQSGYCYMTDHYFNQDVDDGTTILQSPPIDVSNGKAIIEFAYWFDNGIGFTGKSDIFRVYLNDGSQWLLIDTAGPVELASGGWNYRQYWVHDLCLPTNSAILRFDAADEALGSIVEAAVDAVRVTQYSISPYIEMGFLPDAIIDEAYAYQLEAITCAEPLTWSDKNGDLAGTGFAIAADGLVSGISTEQGEVTFTALAVDDAGLVGERQFSLGVWPAFVCGDAFRDGWVNVGDVVFLINYIFKNGDAPYPLEIADANGDGGISVGDAVYLIEYIFKGGADPISE
jgi:hypothetical protein